MSTPAAIIQKQEDGKYRGIYCNFDGYPSHVGKILTTYYNTPELVNELIDLGDISSLAKKVKPDPGTNHSFDERQPDVTVAYARDRGETDVDPITTDSLEHFGGVYDYMYMYVYMHNTWHLADGYNEDYLTPLSYDPNYMKQIESIVSDGRLYINTRKEGVQKPCISFKRGEDYDPENDPTWQVPLC